MATTCDGRHHATAANGTGVVVQCAFACVRIRLQMANSESNSEHMQRPVASALPRLTPLPPAAMSSSGAQQSLPTMPPVQQPMAAFTNQATVADTMSVQQTQNV